MVEGSVRSWVSFISIFHAVNCNFSLNNVGSCHVYHIKIKDQNSDVDRRAKSALSRFLLDHQGGLAWAA